MIESLLNQNVFWIGYFIGNIMMSCVFIVIFQTINTRNMAKIIQAYEKSQESKRLSSEEPLQP